MSLYDKTPQNVTFVGGLRVRWVNFTVPLVLMDADGERLSFTLRLGLRRLFRPWVLRHADIVDVNVKPTMTGIGHGICLRRGGHADWVFWTFAPEAVLEKLRQLGYPVRGASCDPDA